VSCPNTTLHVKNLCITLRLCLGVRACVRACAYKLRSYYFSYFVIFSIIIAIASHLEAYFIKIWELIVITNLTHFFVYLFIYLFHVSTCFERHRRELQFPSDRYTKQSQRLIIPDDVLIQFDLVRMSAVTL